MGLDDLWFVLFVGIVAGYLVLDGFDIGVGMLHQFVARNDDERRLTLNSIGPIWDGNEVWLVIAGGVLFAGFPIVYAALFSGFYWAFVLVLFVLILRTVAIEFRSKVESQRWRRSWDGVFFAASAGLALLLGVAFGNLIRGVPLDEQGEVTIGNLSDLLHPFAIWIGLTTMVMLALHGAHYLNVKTEGTLQARARGLIPWLTILFASSAAASVVFIEMVNAEILDVFQEQIWPVIFPVGAIVSFLLSVAALWRGRELAAFACSATTVALTLFSVASGLYPNLLISSTDAQYNMTASNAASADNTLTVMLIVAIIGIPFIILYTAGVYYLFRGKVRLSPHSY
jgi:cytochrome d ubiquinol oxidase subunit II